MCKQLFLRQKDTKSDLYRAGQDYAIKLYEKYPEAMFYEQIYRAERNYDDPFDKGILDWIEDHKKRQRGGR